MQDQDLAIVRSWRNDPRIRSCFFSQAEISISEHENWFIKKQQDVNNYLKVFELDGQAKGFLQLLCIQRKPEIFEWGFYVAPEHLGQGLGKLLVRSAIEFVFNDLDAKKLIGKVIQGNIVSENIHYAQGFKLEGVLRNECFVYHELKNVLYFGLLKNEWRK